MPKEHSVKRFVRWIAPNAIWDVIKWIGGSSMMTAIGRFCWLEFHRSPVDWYWLCSLLVLGIGLSFVGAWLQHIPARHDHRRREDNAVAYDAAWKAAIEEMVEAAQSAKEAGAQARLLLHFYDQAVLLREVLSSLWHHWNAAGEALVYPIGGKNAWRNWTIDKSLPLENELRDFKVQYSSHINWIRVVFPGFTSILLEHGYPSDAEYTDVVTYLHRHAELLKETAGNVWSTEEPIEALDVKKG